MDGTLLITGATQGIGLACAMRLRDTTQSRIVIVARSQARARETIAKLGDRGECILADLESLSSVRAATMVFRDRLRRGELPPLRGLILNAGIQTSSGPWHYTADGFEAMFAVNHLSQFLMTNLLIDDLEGPARVVFTSSGTHDPDTIDGRFNRAGWTDLAELARPTQSKASTVEHVRRYATTKLCNIYTAYALDRRLRRSERSAGDRKITVNAFDPGAVPGTGLLRAHSPMLRLLFQSKIVGLLTRVEKVEDAGAALASLMTDPALSSVSGSYFAGLRKRSSSKLSYDERAGEELWAQSLRWAGLE